jgi:mRNA interferase HigB
LLIDKYDNLSYNSFMIIIGKNKIAAFGSSHPQSKKPLSVWEGIIKQTNYGSFNELKRTFPTADYVSHQYTIFNIGGNKYQLISEIDYYSGVVNIKRIWTHAEYSMKKNENALRRNII